MRVLKGDLVAVKDSPWFVVTDVSPDGIVMGQEVTYVGLRVEPGKFTKSAFKLSNKRQLITDVSLLKGQILKDQVVLLDVS